MNDLVFQVSVVLKRYDLDLNTNPKTIITKIKEHFKKEDINEKEIIKVISDIYENTYHYGKIIEQEEDMENLI